MKTVILVPAYNAQKTIEGVLNKIPEKSIMESEIVVVDNNSEDETTMVVEKFKKNLPIKLIKNSRNLGYGASQKIGFKYAASAGADCVVLLHSDGQHMPQMVPLFQKAIKDGADVVGGSRILGGNMLKQGMPIHRYIGNCFLTSFANFILRTKIYSWHSGYRAYNKKALEKINFNKFSDSYNFDNEMMAFAAKKKLKIKEIPIPTIYFREKSYLNSITYGFGALGVFLKMFFFDKIGKI